MKFDLDKFIKAVQKTLTRGCKAKTKTVYEWIHEANAGNVNYFVASWVTDENVEYFFGLDAPKQKYKTGRSLEVEV